uniref:Uncharacterized protein n=1 Tax=Arundo donax TaxID=35708 RepID=A0A0A9AWJ5_ARUDO
MDPNLASRQHPLRCGYVSFYGLSLHSLAVFSFRL